MFLFFVLKFTILDSNVVFRGLVLIFCLRILLVFMFRINPKLYIYYDIKIVKK